MSFGNLTCCVLHSECVFNNLIVFRGSCVFNFLFVLFRSSLLQINRPVKIFIRCVYTSDSPMALNTIGYHSKSDEADKWGYNRCGSVIARLLPKLSRDYSGRLWRGYQLCGEITCNEVTRIICFYRLCNPGHVILDSRMILVVSYTSAIIL